MRSDLVFAAVAGPSNRYRLCQLATKATRKFHKPNSRLQDTINNVLVRLGSDKSSKTFRAAGAVSPV